MGGMSRTKGQSGERELARLLAELTGKDVRRRVRQHDGDSDLVGLPGWSIECKRYASASAADIGRWWQQAAAQAAADGAVPLLCWRADRMKDWRFHWPAGLHCKDAPTRPVDVADTLSADPLTWWRMVRAVPAMQKVLPQGQACG
ncbi:hypothetical protein MASR1M59_27870 [Melaminivora sp.]